jgi:hypothetical protein
MAQLEESRRLWLQDPGHGMRSMLGWVVSISLVVFVVILCLSKAFPIALVCTVFTLVLVLLISASAVCMRVYGHISQETMVAMFKLGLNAIPGKSADISVVEAKAALSDGGPLHPQLPEAADAPTISLNGDDE